MLRSAFAPVVVAVAALAGALARWLVQGSGNLYTAPSKRLYVRNADLGAWVESPEHPIWLGLEVCAIIAAIAVGLAIGGWFIRRRERITARPAKVLRIAAWVAAVAPLAVPIAAFATGTGPAGGRSVMPLPGEDTDAAVAAGGGSAASAIPRERPIAGALAAPAGTYAVVAHDGTAITARLKAGGEEFDARFTGDAAGIAGAWTGDPGALAAPMKAEVTANAAAVDTGIGTRSEHARTGYLQAEKFPRVTFALDGLVSARQDGADQVAFRAKGTVGLIGKTHAVEFDGTLRRPDAAALGRLGLRGDVLLVQASFALLIKDTALAPDAGDFNNDRIPIHVSLVLRRTGG
ncbi:MAG: YceI family protein [Deltaproteobacteria bacterium]|nr:YceI family protein [Deltaproteobacteria bacterium]MCW5804620.1 YceI family protein [Deltaproteobacteria bacterium]